MSDENKEEVKEKKEEAPKASPKEEPKAKPEAAPAPAAKASPAEGEGEPKKPKLSRLSLKEVEEGIKKCQEKMGGLHSQYARFLLRRKQILTTKQK